MIHCCGRCRGAVSLSLASEIFLLNALTACFKLDITIPVIFYYSLINTLIYTKSPAFGGWHPHFSTFTRIENFYPLSPALSINNRNHPYFVWWKQKCPGKYFCRKKREILVIDLSVVHQISYVWVMKFKSVFYHLANWFSNSIGRHNKDKH